MINPLLPTLSSYILVFLTLIAVFNGQISEISACDPGYYYDTTNGYCKQGIAFCQTYIAKTTTCQACITGYTLSSNICIIVNDVFDPCIQYGFAKDCLNCANRYYVNKNKSCSPADPLCRTYNTSNGNCFTCYDGYELSNRKCVKIIATCS